MADSTPPNEPERFSQIQRKKLDLSTALPPKGKKTPAKSPPRPTARTTAKPKKLTSPNKKGKKVTSKSTSLSRRSPPKEESHRRKYALKKKSLRSLFPVADIIKVRPGASLTAHQTYATDTVPEIIKRVEKGKSKRCVIDLLTALEDVEFSLMNRLGIVSNLKMEAGAPNELKERRYRVISLVAEKLLEVQQLIEKEQLKRDEKRQELHNRRGRFVCCSFCDKSGSRQAR